MENSPYLCTIKQQHINSTIKIKQKMELIAQLKHLLSEGTKDKKVSSLPVTDKFLSEILSDIDTKIIKYITLHETVVNASRLSAEHWRPLIKKTAKTVLSRFQLHKEKELVIAVCNYAEKFY